MPRGGGSSIDTRQVLKTYNITSTNPQKWQDSSTAGQSRRAKPSRKQNRYSVLQDQRLDYDESVPRQEALEDEEDPLGIYGPVFGYFHSPSVSSPPSQRVSLTIRPGVRCCPCFPA